jgi:FAD/FMN-containing dehydrogenase
MTEPLYSWGRVPDAPQTPHAVHWRDELGRVVDDVVRAHGTTLPFGNGRSYGDSCLAASDHVVQTKALDRVIDDEWKIGIIRAESGITLGEILALAIPRGWFLPVAPGTQFATFGGAIANDVHGKNHHVRGTFGNHVRRFGLRRHGREAVTCSPTEQPELFAATIGGLGLTGIIDWAEIKLMPIRSTFIDGTAMRFDSLTEFFVLSRELDPHHEYSAAWIDCLSKAGRGVLMVGNHATGGDLQPSRRGKPQVPLTPRWSLINKLTLRVFNEVYWRAHRSERGSLWVDYEPFLFPLDRVLNWNRIYGRKGFQQYQCVIPEDAAEPAMSELIAATAKAGQGSCLAVLKRCGATASPGLLSFPMPGTSLALDFPQSASLERDLFPRLDAIVRDARGRLYPAKDAHMTGADFRRAYPAWEKVEALRDPALNSRFWQRVTQ